MNLRQVETAVWSVIVIVLMILTYEASIWLF